MMILSKIYDIVSEELAVDKSMLSPETNFKNDLDIDSLAFFQIATSIEEEFFIEIPYEDIEQIKTINDLHNKIKNLK